MPMSDNPTWIDIIFLSDPRNIQKLVNVVHKYILPGKDRQCKAHVYINEIPLSLELVQNEFLVLYSFESNMEI